MSEKRLLCEDGQKGSNKRPRNSDSTTQASTKPYKEEGTELLDTDSDASEDQKKWKNIERNYTFEKSLANQLIEHPRKSPIFLRKHIRAMTLEIDKIIIDLRSLENDSLEEAVNGIEDLIAKADSCIAWSHGENNDKIMISTCQNLWIMDTENVLFIKKCLTKAQQFQSHRKVSQKKNERFHSWHKRWVERNVNDEQKKRCNNWLIGQCGSNKWNAIVKKFNCEWSLANQVIEQSMKCPKFRPRHINCWWSHIKTLSAEEQDKDLAGLGSTQEEIDESKIDFGRLVDDGFKEGVKVLVCLNVKGQLHMMMSSPLNEENDGESSSSPTCQSYLNLYVRMGLSCWVHFLFKKKCLTKAQQEIRLLVLEKSSSPLACQSYVKMYVRMGFDHNENFLYKEKCLTKAHQSHRKVSQKLNERFRRWHNSWLKRNVNDEQEKRCRNWLLGQYEDNIPNA